VLSGRSIAASVLCASALVVGCSSRPGDDQQPQEVAPPREVTLRTVDPADFDVVVKKYRGQVLLVDFWATWCTTCLELFPHSVAIGRELADRGLAVVSVSFDDAGDEPQVRKFLSSQQATFENLRATTGASPESAAAFGIENGIPYLRLYDRAGKLRKTFESPIKPAAVEEAVRQLLAEPA
jgi:thiol-disulfide isomerase/thioredoxin